MQRKSWHRGSLSLCNPISWWHLRFESSWSMWRYWNERRMLLFAPASCTCACRELGDPRWLLQRITYVCSGVLIPEMRRLLYHVFQGGGCIEGHCRKSAPPPVALSLMFDVCWTCYRNVGDVTGCSFQTACAVCSHRGRTADESRPGLHE